MPCSKTAAATAIRSTFQNGSGGGIVAMHWFRKGLRLHDNPALMECLTKKNKSSSTTTSATSMAVQKIYPVYVLDGNSYQLVRCTPLRAQFLIECLHDLDTNLRALGSRLYVLVGDPTVVLPQQWDVWNISRISYEDDESGEPYATTRDHRIVQLAKEKKIEIITHCSETMFPLKAYVQHSKGNVVPTSMSTFQKLFDHMMKIKKEDGMSGMGALVPAPTMEDFPPQQQQQQQEQLVDTERSMYNLPKHPTDLPWPRGVPKSQVEPIWGPKDCHNLTPLVHGGETRAVHAMTESLKDANWVATFEKPTTSCTNALKPSTTGLSPYLSLGCLSPRQVWAAVDDAITNRATTSRRSMPPVSLHGQLLWRDFNNLMAHDANNHHQLINNNNNNNGPNSGNNSPRTDAWNRIEHNKYCRQTIDWDDDPKLVQAWKEGKTGYPFIDATMRQLSTTGWIHHLGRHAVACFLTRGDLWQSWEVGAQHFEATLLDADYALNGFNWLWLSCSGFFYQYFRCYSPISFQKKNDPTGAYIRHYCPELKNVPARYIYEPWTAPSTVLQKAGVTLGKTYPHPIVDHAVISKENMNRMKQAYDAHKMLVEQNNASNTGRSMSKRGGATSTGDARKRDQDKKKRRTE